MPVISAERFISKPNPDIATATEVERWIPAPGVGWLPARR
jgi:hypothetical protein